MMLFFCNQLYGCKLFIANLSLVCYCKWFSSRFWNLLYSKFMFSSYLPSQTEDIQSDVFLFTSPQKEYKHWQQLLSCCLADGSFHDSSSAAIVSHRANFVSNHKLMYPSSVALLSTISLNWFKNWFCFTTNNNFLSAETPFFLFFKYIWS